MFVRWFYGKTFLNVTQENLEEKRKSYPKNFFEKYYFGSPRSHRAEDWTQKAKEQKSLKEEDL